MQLLVLKRKTGGFGMTRNSKSATAALAVLGGVYCWRNRALIQQKFQSLTKRSSSLFKGDISQVAEKVASEAQNKMEQGATIAESQIQHQLGGVH